MSKTEHVVAAKSQKCPVHENSVSLKVPCGAFIETKKQKQKKVLELFL